MIRPALLAAVAIASPAWAASSPPLTPAPAKVVAGLGAFHLTAATRIHVPTGDVEAHGVAVQLADLLQRARGLRPAVVESPPKAGEAAIVLARGEAEGEAYALNVAPEGVTISARHRAGMFYGAVSLWQLAVADEGRGAADLPAVTIDDAPRFAWRGFMLDSARHVQSVDTIKRLIDGMAAYKLNTLHWHLVDDQGWRLEIRKYPKLTRVGAWRTPAGAAGRDPKTGRPVRYGGFYTQDQVRELVAYAAARNVTIVPEIEMPGHALAPIVAYPELGMTAIPPASAMGDWGVFPWLYNVDDKTFTFLADVLDEVMDLFPSPYIHIGGDEAIKDQWKASPRIQARIKALGLKDEHELQSWFIRRVETHINARGRRLIGWDEILEGGLAPNAAVMSWRGVEGGVAAARAGHDAVLSPKATLYLDRRQSASPDEPPGRLTIIGLKDVYGFDASPDDLTPEENHHILGVQANLWTEHVRTDARAQAMAFPRLVALSEVTWSPEARRDWPGFAARLPADIARLKALGIAADAVPFEPQARLEPRDGGTVGATLQTGVDAGQIRFTTDGAEPTRVSPLYGGALSLPAGTILKARGFIGDQPLGRVRAWTLDPSAEIRASQQLELCKPGAPINLEDDAPANGRSGERAVFAVDVEDRCWIWKAVDLSRPLRLTARIGQVPYNFRMATPRKMVSGKPAPPGGELEIRLGCDGERIAALPLGRAGSHPGLTTVRGTLPARPGRHDLCFTSTTTDAASIEVIERIELAEPKFR